MKIHFLGGDFLSCARIITVTTVRSQCGHVKTISWIFDGLYRQTGPRAPSGRTHKKSSPTSISHNRLSDPNGNRPLPDPTQIPNEDNYGYLNPGEDKYGYTGEACNNPFHNGIYSTCYV